MKTKKKKEDSATSLPTAVFGKIFGLFGFLRLFCVCVCLFFFFVCVCVCFLCVVWLCVFCFLLAFLISHDKERTETTRHQTNQKKKKNGN